jgi:hypothetical protein
VSWSFRLRERALLNISNRRRAFEQQTLQVRAAGSPQLGWIR